MAALAARIRDGRGVSGQKATPGQIKVSAMSSRKPAKAHQGCEGFMAGTRLRNLLEARSRINAKQTRKGGR